MIDLISASIESHPYRVVIQNCRGSSHTLSGYLSSGGYTVGCPRQRELDEPLYQIVRSSTPHDTTGTIEIQHVPIKIVDASQR